MERTPPDVLLLDVHMRGGASLDMIPLARGGDERAGAHDAGRIQLRPHRMRAGARGYVLKEAEDAELVQAVRTVAAGGTYLDPALGGRLFAADDGPGELTEREREVLGLIALGHTNSEMAKRLFLSLRTIETHRANIHRKLGTDSRAELVRHALEQGLVKP